MSLVWDLQQLRTCLKTKDGGFSLRIGTMKNATLVTPKGVCYRIDSTRLVGVAKPWWKPPLLFMRFFLADIEVSETGRVDVEELKMMLRRAYKADPLGWDAGWGEFAEFDREVSKCTTFEDVKGLLRIMEDPNARTGESK